MTDSHVTSSMSTQTPAISFSQHPASFSTNHQIQSTSTSHPSVHITSTPPIINNDDNGAYFPRLFHHLRQAQSILQRTFSKIWKAHPCPTNHNHFLSHPTVVNFESPTAHLQFHMHQRLSDFSSFELSLLQTDIFQIWQTIQHVLSHPTSMLLHSSSSHIGELHSSNH